jgi:hypothetical protein
MEKKNWSCRGSHKDMHGLYWVRGWEKAGFMDTKVEWGKQNYTSKVISPKHSMTTDQPHIQAHTCTYTYCHDTEPRPIKGIRAERKEIMIWFLIQNCWEQNGRREDKGKLWREWIQLWYIIRTFVNVTIYPQYDNKKQSLRTLLSHLGQVI